MLMFKKNLMLGKGVHAFFNKNKFVVIRGIHKKDLIVSHSVVVRYADVMVSLHSGICGKQIKSRERDMLLTFSLYYVY